MSNKQIYAILAVLLAWFWGVVIAVVWHFAAPTPKRYDCSMAEFHPDYPPKVRQLCREARQ
jgi:hypothetical protein